MKRLNNEIAVNGLSKIQQWVFKPFLSIDYTFLQAKSKPLEPDLMVSLPSKPENPLLGSKALRGTVTSRPAPFSGVTRETSFCSQDLAMYSIRAMAASDCLWQMANLSLCLRS